MTDTSWEHAAEARAALNAIVTDPEHGIAALSSPQTMSNLLKDLLPDAPKEKSLLVAAAEAGLATKLKEHVDLGMDPGTAIKLTASSFSTTTPFTSDACAWVTGEIAGALGISEPPGSAPSSSQPQEYDLNAMPTQATPIPGYTPPGQFGQQGQGGQPGQFGQAGFGQQGQSGQPGQFGQAGFGGQSGEPGQFGQAGFGQAGGQPSAPGQQGYRGPDLRKAPAPGQGYQSAQGQGAQSAPGQGSASAPGQGYQPGSGYTSAPGQGSPGPGYTSAPGQGAPGQGYTSAPGQGAPGQGAPGQGAPGQGFMSSPGQDSQSAPGQRGYSPATPGFPSPPGQVYQGPAAQPAGARGFPPAPGPNYAIQPGSAGPKRNGLAIASLVCGIAQFVLWLAVVLPGLITAVAAIICGAISLKQIRQTGDAGRGMAITGIVLSVVGIVLVTIGIIALVAVAPHQNT
jgi:hypothetical protein